MPYLRESKFKKEDTKEGFITIVKEAE